MRAEDSAKWLRHIRRKQREIVVLKERVATLDGMVKGLDYTTPRVASSPSNDAIPDFVARLEEARERYDTLVSEYAQEVIECHDAIYRLENPMHRMVLELYYLDGKKWDEVAAKTHISEDYAKHLSYDARELLWWHIPMEWRTRH